MSLRSFVLRGILELERTYKLGGRLWRWTVSNMESGRIREYKAVVWTDDASKPGERITLIAKSLDDARKQLIERFGPSTVSSIWNEEDANRER